MKLIEPGIRLDDEIYEEICTHGERAFPEECCGIMLGCLDEDDRPRHIRKVISIANTFRPAESAPAEDTNSKNRRYMIEPLELMRAEREARAQGMDVVGIYHSHPNHPSVASEFDRAHAMPFWSYIIVSIQNGKRDTMQSWRLKDDRSQFEEEKLILSASDS